MSRATVWINSIITFPLNHNSDNNRQLLNFEPVFHDGKLALSFFAKNVMMDVTFSHWILTIRVRNKKDGTAVSILTTSFDPSGSAGLSLDCPIDLAEVDYVELRDGTQLPMP